MISNKLTKTKIDEISSLDNPELIKKFAPVLFFHPDEAWLPSKYSQMLQSGILKNKKREEVIVDSKRFSELSLDEKEEYLANLNKSKKYYIDLPEINIEELQVTFDDKVNYGLTEVVNSAKQLYGNNPVKNYKLSSEKYKGSYYARVKKLKIGPRPGNPRTDKHMKKYEGEWIIIQYFFFYLFNSSTNIHEGDWDSGITVCVNKKERTVLTFYYQHHTSWLCYMNTDSVVPVEAWLESWGSYEKKPRNKPYKSPEFSLSINETHPVGFVTLGAHGVYPTPGYTMFGINIPIFKDDIPFVVDERGSEFCIAPKDIIDNSSWPVGLGCNHNFVWDEPGVIQEKQKKSIFSFEGHWGEVVNHKIGWDGPLGPRFSSAWENFANKRNFLELLKNDRIKSTGRYFRGGKPFSKIFQSKHTFYNR